MADPPPSVLAQKPWRNRDALGRGGPVGMLGQAEGNLLYYLARDYYLGDGVIVDAGSFVGRSAWCFARGLAANARLAPHSGPRIHCFDNFLVNDTHTVRVLADAFGLRREIGETIRDVFDRALSGDAHWLEVHQGDFLTINWTPRPIEILLVDIAKTPALNQHLVESMFPHLIPGHSIVVQQDYHHPWLPHVHSTMELLHDYFDLVEAKCDDSAVFRLTRPVPAGILTAAASTTLPAAQRIALIDAAIQRLPPTARRHVALARAYLIGQAHGYDAMRVALQDAESHPADSADQSWERYLADMRGTLEQLARGMGRAWEAMNRGEVARAVAIAESVDRGEPEYYASLVVRAHGLRRLGRHDEAAAVVAEGIAQQSGRVEMWVERAWLEADGGVLPAAVESAQRAAALAGGDAKLRAAALDVLAYALSLSGRHEEALDASLQALISLPATGWLLEHHAYALLRAGRPDEALRAAEEALVHSPGSSLAKQLVDRLSAG